MKTYVRLTYASQATATSGKIRDDLNDIINISTLRNPPTNITGVLYYGSTYFFQCLEGKKSVVDELYERIKRDRRHKNITLLSYENISHPIFDCWNTKFYLLDEPVKTFFAQYSLAQFNPFVLKGELITPFIQMIKNKQDIEYIDYDDKSYMTNTMSDEAGTVKGQKYVIFMIGVALVLFGLLYLCLPNFGLASGF